MKKRAEWLTKNLKRKIRQNDRGIADFIWVQKHFFKDTNDWIGALIQMTGLPFP